MCDEATLIEVDHAVGGGRLDTAVGDEDDGHAMPGGNPASRSRISSRPRGSTIDVTSSAMSNCGLRANAAATASRCCCPPDRSDVSR